MPDKRQKIVKEAYMKTLKTMTPIIMTAMITTALGFLSLQASPVPMIRDFGVMLMSGVIISFILMVFILSLLLFMRDYHFTDPTKEKVSKKPKRSPTEGKVFRFTKAFIQKTLSFRVLLVLLAIGAAGYGFYVDQDADVETDVEAFMPQDSAALDDIHTLRDRLDSSEELSVVYSSDDVLDESSLEWVAMMSDDLKAFDEVVDVRSVHTMALTMEEDPYDPAAMRTFISDLPDDMSKTLIDEDGNEAVLTIMIKDMDAASTEAFIDELKVFLDTNTPATLDYRLAGQALVDTEMISALTYDRYTITFIGLGLVFLSLLIIYRSFLKALFPLIPVTLLIGWTGLTMYLLDIAYTPLTATLGALTIGIAVDFSILVMGRVKEEKKHYSTQSEAISAALGHMIKPISIAAFTTMGGFSVLLLSDFQILNNFGIMTVITLGFALLSVVFVMPSFLYMQGQMESLRIALFKTPKKYRDVLEENKRLRLENRYLKTLDAIVTHVDTKRFNDSDNLDS